MHGIIFSDISDHLPIVHMLNTSILKKSTKENTNTVTYQRIFNKANIRNFYKSNQRPFLE